MTTQTTQLPKDTAQKLRLGSLFYLMGASGSGKDSVMTLVREGLDSRRCLIAHRYITRRPELKGENHVWLLKEEFEARKSLGAFAMSWEANGHTYAIGNEVNQWLMSGVNVLVNGSRGYLQQAQRGYGIQLVPVLLRVRPECLRARLEARGRETPDEIDRRVERAGLQDSPMLGNLLTVDNNGSIEDAAEALRSIIESANGS